MTREDIIRMAREELWGISTGRWLIPTESLERIVNRAVEAEREALADYANALAEAGWSAGAIADAIRARGNDGTAT